MQLLVFTPEPYQQILNLINKDSTPQEAAVNMEGISNCLSACLSSSLDIGPWVVDIGATNHLISSLNLLLNSIVVSPSSSKIHLPNGQTNSISHIGTVSLFDHQLHNVLYVPHFKYNLPSISKLTKELNIV